MSEHFWLEALSVFFGSSLAIAVLRNRKTQEAGIGPRTIQALVVCLIAPVLLILGIEKVLTSETIAAMVGALIGYGIPKAGSD
jgi:hypothetical protein